MWLPFLYAFMIAAPFLFPRTFFSNGKDHDHDQDQVPSPFMFPRVNAVPCLQSYNLGSDDSSADASAASSDGEANPAATTEADIHSNAGAQAEGEADSSASSAKSSVLQYDSDEYMSSSTQNQYQRMLLEPWQCGDDEEGHDEKYVDHNPFSSLTDDA
jgi:hypothetical protein